MFSSLTKRFKRKSSPFVPNHTSDVFLASYPRSGNTWLRAVVFAIEMGRPPDGLVELDFVVPDEHYPVADTRPARNKRSGSMIVKTHSLFAARYRRYVYVIRHPLDCLESYHRYLQATTGTSLPIIQFARDAVAGRIWPGSWSEHVMSWTFGKDSDFVVRYESLVRCDGIALRRLSKILGIRDERQLEDAIRYFDVDRMKELEQLGNRPSLETRGRDWFISGKRSSENRETIRDTAMRYRPELAQLAQSFDYDF